MDPNLVMLLGIAFVSLIAGWQGLGVGFLALPVFALFFPDFILQVQSHALLLSSITALVILVISRKNLNLDWKQILILGSNAAITGSLGGLMSHSLKDHGCIIMIFFGYTFLVFYLPLNFIKEAKSDQLNFGLVIGATTITGLLASLIGIGPGYMLLPLLMFSGLGVKQSIAISALVEILVSIFALLPRLSNTSWQSSWLLVLVFTGALFAFLGAHLSKRYQIKRAIKVVVIVGLLVLVLFAAKETINFCPTFTANNRAPEIAHAIL